MFLTILVEQIKTHILYTIFPPPPPPPPTQNGGVTVENGFFENVTRIKCLGTVLTNHRCVCECVNV